MEYFVSSHSIVRKIWGRADTVLLIFAGASAEFALNKAVDWLYFTGKLPADPIGRLFSTVTYARKIIFREKQAALQAIDQISTIHKGVEQSRGANIPDWAYRDVLFMLIDYTIRSFELLHRKLTGNEKAEIFDVFYRFGERMHIPGLPENFSQWETMRQEHLSANLSASKFTVDLYRQYKKNLGTLRFYLLKQVQILLVPRRVNRLLALGSWSLLAPAIPLYKLARRLQLDKFVQDILFPHQYKQQIRELDNPQI
ncbi:DUF2236 domain-containing protein [Pedobacter sp. BS3]|uniref:oxygenase MpaB family protein n=1 Tax=Pedobacter sp. BS3 TaxID=2567937 RepID=UPI0011EE39F8|nr:oxygenase MpaB family protein [Pedobacter sp. BS3]TZF84781.1 DUF2236 domain-containing protein [Pedobacter sp. BS3]